MDAYKAESQAMTMSGTAADRAIRQGLRTMSRGIKWNIAKPTWVDGIKFASKAEAKRYQQLRLLEHAGAISGLEVQPCYPLEAVNPLNGEVTPVGVYKADFRYQENGLVKVEDVKGMRTVVYRLKKRMVEGQYGIQIQEIK